MLKYTYIMKKWKNVKKKIFKMLYIKTKKQKAGL